MKAPFSGAAMLERDLPSAYMQSTSRFPSVKRYMHMYSGIQVTLRNCYLDWLPKLFVLNTGQSVIR